jgi:DNA-binding transcriptional LysR family regulator
MRAFKGLDPTSLRAFQFAAVAGNFTEAARQAGLTQSGISQHVAKLEEELGVTLFYRTGKRVSATPHARRLLSFIDASSDQMDQLLEEFQVQERKLLGRVTYAMPDSCLMTPHFQMLLDRRGEFSELDLRVEIAHTEQVLELLLAAEVDFGFVTRERTHPALAYREFAREEYVLVGRVPVGEEFWLEPFVSYPGMDTIFESWKQLHFPHLKVTRDGLRIRGEINDLAGAITMVRNGVGISVFPRHCVERELTSGALQVLAGKKGRQFPIWIVQRKDVIPSARVRKVLDVFWEMVEKGDS